MAVARYLTTNCAFCFVEFGRFVTMWSNKPALLAASVIGGIASFAAGAANARAQTPTASGYIEPLAAGTREEIATLYGRLIEAENRHDLAEVRTILWDSPATLFVAKTATAAEGNWAGFWGTDVVMHHFAEIYDAGSFRIDPDYDKEKVVGLTRDVAETYVPVKITVAYAGQTPVAKPFP